MTFAEELDSGRHPAHGLAQVRISLGYICLKVLFDA